jgi:hypothetical protein
MAVCGAVTVVLGLGFHMFVFLPCVYAFIVRKNPFVVRNTPLYCVLCCLPMHMELRLVHCTTGVCCDVVWCDVSSCRASRRLY